MSEVVADPAVRKKIEKFQEDGFGNLPICIAKTQYSFSTDPQLRDRDRAVRALRRAAEGDCEHRGAELIERILAHRRERGVTARYLRDPQTGDKPRTPRPNSTRPRFDGSLVPIRMSDEATGRGIANSDPRYQIPIFSHGLQERGFEAVSSPKGSLPQLPTRKSGHSADMI